MHLNGKKDKKNEEKKNYAEMTDLEKMEYNLKWAARENEKSEKLSRAATIIMIMGYVLVILTTVLANLPL